MFVVYHFVTEQFLKIRWDETYWVDNIHESNRFPDIKDIKTSILADFKHDWYHMKCVIVPVKLVNNIIEDVFYELSIPLYDSLTSS